MEDILNVFHSTAAAAISIVPYSLHSQKNIIVLNFGISYGTEFVIAGTSDSVGRFDNNVIGIT